MNREFLLNHFNRISDAPDAVPRLRSFIRDLAVRGKLVEQSRKDVLSEELLSKGPDANHGLPEKWFRCKVGKLLNFQYGKGLPDSSRQEKGPVPVFGSNGIVAYTVASLTKNPAIIIGRKGSAGALNLCAGPSWTTDVAYFTESPAFFDMRFLFIELETLHLDQLGKGVKPGLSRRDAYDLELVVPPIAEQCRIVAKVDELMALCDRLDNIQRERETRRDRLTAALHHHLNDGANSEAFGKHARFYLRHIPRFTINPTQVPAIRQTILNLAVRGQLISQNANDEPASLLSERLTEEINKYCREQGVSQPRPDPITEGDVPHPLPNGWIWTRLCSIFKVITDGDHQPPPKEPDGVAFLTIGNITTGSLDFSNCRFVSPSYLESVAEYRKPLYGDILYTVVGATYGRPVLVDTKRPFCVQRHIAILKPPKDIDIKFMRFLLASTLVYAQATKSATGAAQPTVALKPLRNFLVPLPPLAEQHRIVVKVDELTNLCDLLEAQLTTARTETGRLLESVLHHALIDDPLRKELVKQAALK
jgi:type I restriction enzyme S subunit